MSSAPGQKGNKPGKQLAAIDRLLIAGIKQGLPRNVMRSTESFSLSPAGPARIVGSVSDTCERLPTSRLLRTATQARQKNRGHLARSGGRLAAHGRRQMTTGY